MSYDNYDLYFAPVDDPNNKKQLFDYDGANFGINIQDGYSPIAIEVITDSSNGDQYLGAHILLALDEYASSAEEELVGFLFDADGYILDYVGPPVDDQGINDAENLFGFDLNKDGKQGGLIEENLPGDPAPAPIPVPIASA